MVDEFVCAAGGNAVLMLARGALRFTGGVAKDVTRAVKLVTLTAMIGIRGTDF